MKSFLILLLFPICVQAQQLKQRQYDQRQKTWRMESFPLNLKTASDIKMDVSVRSSGDSVLLQLAGSGIGANTVLAGDEVIFLLENDSTVTVISPSLQQYDKSKAVKSYKHEYLLSFDDLDDLSQHSLRALRKYSTEGYDDIYFDKANATKLKDLSAFFLDELKKENAIPVKFASRPPGFPGGTDVLAKFLNRNVKLPDIKSGEQKKAVVQFLVTADGSVEKLHIKESAGEPVDNELMRVLQRMPKWKPAFQHGKEIESTVTKTITVSRINEVVKVEI